MTSTRHCSPDHSSLSPKPRPRIVPYSGLIGTLQAIRAHAHRDPVARTCEATQQMAKMPRKFSPPMWKPSTAAQEKTLKTLGYFGPLYGSRLRPHLITLWNRRPILDRIRDALPPQQLPDWLLQPLDPSDVLKHCHDRFYRQDDSPMVWCPVRVPGGQRHKYGIYYTLANRIDYIERLREYSGGTYGPAYADLLELQDQYQLLSLHMELKGTFTNQELLRVDPETGVCPLELYWPDESVPFTRSHLPDLRHQVTYLRYWGDKPEGSWVDPQVRETVQLAHFFNTYYFLYQVLRILGVLSKALPSPCKSRSAETLLPPSWLDEDADTNGVFFDCVLRIIVGALLGVHEQCRVRSHWYARHQIYRMFLLQTPDRAHLREWTHRHKRKITYAFRSFLLAELEDVPSLHQLLCDIYDWQSYAKNAFDAMDQVRRHFNKSMGQHACLPPVVASPEVGPMGLTVFAPFGMLLYKSECNEIYRALWRRYLSPGEGDSLRLDSLCYEDVFFAPRPPFQQEPGKNKNARTSLTADGYSSQSLLPWSPGYSGFEGQEAMLATANKLHLRTAPRPMEADFITVINRIFRKLDEEHHSNERLWHVSRQVWTAEKRDVMWQLVCHEPGYDKRYCWLARTFGVRPFASIERLYAAETLYRRETNRTTIKYSLQQILAEDPYDYCALEHYFACVKRKFGLQLFYLPRHIAEKQVRLFHEIYGTLPGEALHPDAGLYFYCPNCENIKTTVFDGILRRSKRKKKKKKKQGQSATTAVQQGSALGRVRQGVRVKKQEPEDTDNESSGISDAGLTTDADAEEEDDDRGGPMEIMALDHVSDTEENDAQEEEEEDDDENNNHNEEEDEEEEEDEDEAGSEYDSSSASEEEEEEGEEEKIEDEEAEMVAGLGGNWDAELQGDILHTQMLAQTLKNEVAVAVPKPPVPGVAPEGPTPLVITVKLNNLLFTGSERLSRYSLYSVGTCIDLGTGHILCAKKASRNNPKKRSSATDMVSQLTRSRKTEANEKRKKFKDERKRQEMERCVRTRLSPFYAIGKLFWTKATGAAMSCPSCACLTAMSRFHLEVHRPSISLAHSLDSQMSEGEHNCGCRRSKFIIEILKKKTLHRCALCLRATQDVSWRFALDDEDPRRCCLRNLPLCQTHADMWGEASFVRGREVLRLSSQRHALLMNYRRVQLEDGTFIYAKPSGGSIHGGGANSTPKSTARPVTATADLKGKVFVDRRRSSILASAEAVQTEMHRLKTQQVPEIRRRPVARVRARPVDYETYDSTASEAAGVEALSLDIV
jgi:hypothetical protein